MCWNWQVSLGSFLFISIVAKKLYERNGVYDRLTAIVFFIGGFMQFLEFGMWKTLNNLLLNRIFSFLACFIILLHPIAIYFGIKKDKLDKELQKEKDYSKKNRLMRGLLFASVCYLLFGSYKIIDYTLIKNFSEYKFLALPDKNTGGLSWSFPGYYNHTLIIAIFYAILISSYNWLYPVILVSLWIIIALIINIFISFDSPFVFNNVAGSYWCLYTAILIILFYYMNPYLVK